MKHKLRSLLFAATAFVAMNTVTPVYAVSLPIDVISINGGQFMIDEYFGSYTVINNSSNLYIYGFAVSNPDALSASPPPSTGFTNWNAYAVSLPLGGPTAVPANAYVTGDADLSHINNVFLTTLNTANYIAPGHSSSLFYFGSAAASDAGLLVVDSLGNESQFSSTANTPLPSTWLMLLSGFVGLGFFAYRGTKKNAAALAA
jgi:hypothetical protein